jgi:hypothetical protein
MGVSPERVILVNSIFQKYLWETPGIAPVYAVFSPVRPAGTYAFQQPLVLVASSDHYSLCFHSFHSPFFFPAHGFILEPLGVRIVLSSAKEISGFTFMV